MYTVCFTANATSAIKLVGDAYPFGKSRGLLLSADNHNSVNGIREYARRAGAPVRYLDLDADLRLRDPDAALDVASRAMTGGLFAFPAQSNFSGVQHALDLVARAQRRRLRRAARRRGIRAQQRPRPARARAGLRGALVLQDVRLSHRHRRAHRAAGFTRRPASPVVRRRSGGFRLRAERHAPAHAGRPRIRGRHARFSQHLRACRTASRFSNALALHGFTTTSRGSPRHCSTRFGDSDTAMVARSLRVYGPRADARTRRHGRVQCRRFRRRPCFVFSRGAARSRARRRAPRRLLLQSRMRRVGVRIQRGPRARGDAGAAREGFTIERFAAHMGRDVAVGAMRASLGMANNVRDVERAVAVVASFAD